MAKLSRQQYGTLLLIEGATYSAEEENAKRARTGTFRRVPVGHVSKPDRTLYGLERRGLVDKTASGPGIEPGSLLWTLTKAGQEALNAGGA